VSPPGPSHRSAPDTAAAWRVCRNTLPEVSRTFSLTIRVLPAQLRDPVTVAYLLCRMADVLEDATAADPAQRIDGLERLAEAIGRPAGRPVELCASLDGFEDLAGVDAGGARLLERRAAVFAAYAVLPPVERAIIARWVQAMALGMASYVDRERRRRNALGLGRGNVAASAAAAAFRDGDGVTGPHDDPCPAAVPFVLGTAEELRAYAWYVAGTVGHLLTELFELHAGPGRAGSARMRELAAPFGLGLQFTNILQDLAEDRRRGWSYIPEELARAHGTSIQSLGQPGELPAALRVVGTLVQEAAGYLDRAIEYTLLVPRRAPRIRLFCLWPTFFALRTLVRIWGEEQVVTGSERVRITRPEVRRVLGETAVLCLSDGGLRRLYAAEKSRLFRRMRLQPV